MVSVMAQQQDVIFMNDDTNNATRIRRNQNQGDSFRPRGYRVFIEIGGSKEFDKTMYEYYGMYGGGNFNFSVSNGWQISPYFYVGTGFGVEYHGGLSTVFVPIFGNLRTNFIDKKYTPFLDVKAGYSLVDGMGAYFSPSLGVSFGVSPKCCINFSVGYTMQGVKVDYYYYSYYYDYVYSDSELFHALTF
jgi:hypothetical protein